MILGRPLCADRAVPSHSRRRFFPAPQCACERCRALGGNWVSDRALPLGLPLRLSLAAAQPGWDTTFRATWDNAISLVVLALAFDDGVNFVRRLFRLFFLRHGELLLSWLQCPACAGAKGEGLAPASAERQLGEWGRLSTGYLGGTARQENGEPCVSVRDVYNYVYHKRDTLEEAKNWLWTWARLDT
jgi:hypothetical protein